ncbi:hypothetical protein L0F81_00030 [Streptomyces tricolor]|uniref:DUF222 domain-containing protein n=1 Tax=Streptomyces tricolor TaxID=68277 RepID=A0ABS9J7Z0_9ACTN|nr:hypothetical protein [Streptomyces tricolor]MCG0061686.1 hypothetical protein [Streptomyces tricolor]
MTQPTPKAADLRVAEARRAVHESLVLLPAGEADRVRALIADLETAVEGRAAMRAAASAVVSPPPSRAAVPADWIDGHPQLEAIAAAVWEHCRTEGTSIVADDPRNIAVAALAAAFPAPTGQAAGLLWAADQIDAETRQAKADGVLEPDKFRPCRDASAQLRRLAGEQPEPPATGSSLTPADWAQAVAAARLLGGHPADPGVCEVEARRILAAGQQAAGDEAVGRG